MDSEVEVLGSMATFKNNMCDICVWRADKGVYGARVHLPGSGVGVLRRSLLQSLIELAASFGQAGSYTHLSLPPDAGLQTHGATPVLHELGSLHLYESLHHCTISLSTIVFNF